MQEIWLSRLQEAQERYRLACRRAESLVLKGSSLDSSETPGEPPRTDTTAMTSNPSYKSSATAPVHKKHDDPDPSRKNRSCSSDAATTTTETFPVPRRISEPVYCSSGSSGEQAAGYSATCATGGAAAVIFTTTAIVTSCQDPSSESSSASSTTNGAARSRNLFARRQMASLDEDRGGSGRPAAASLQGSPPGGSGEASPTSFHRLRHRSLWSRRSLKSMKEKSMSVDPMDVRGAL